MHFLQDLVVQFTINHSLFFNVILLGCTELSLAQEKAPDHPYNVIDPQSIIADVSIELALKIRNGMDSKKACAKYMYK